MECSPRLYCYYVCYYFLSRFHLAPRKDHLTNIQNICSYLKKCTSTSIKFNTKMPVYYNFNNIEGNWGNLYAGEPEDPPHSFPTPIGNPVLISIFFDASLMNYLTMGRYHTGIINILDKTPI